MAGASDVALLTYEKQLGTDEKIGRKKPGTDMKGGAGISVFIL